MCIFLVSVGEFLLREVNGAYTPATSTQRLAALSEAWDRDRSRNILIDLRNADVRFLPADVRSHVGAVIQSGIGRGRSVAILYSPRPGFDAVRFFEFLMTKRSDLQLKVFECFEEAMRWLSSFEGVSGEGKREAG
jgi:hypothetical protein